MIFSKRQAQRKGFFFLAALCCAVSLFLPAAAAHAQEEALLARIFPRPAMEGTLDERVREMPLVYALYRRRYLTDNYYGLLVSDPETGEWAAPLREKTEELIRADVLPGDTARQVRESMNALKDEIGGSSDGSFSCAGGGNMSGDSLVLYWHEGTGRVVSFSMAADAREIDPAALLSQYRDYLGLDALDDWTDVDLPHANGCACWSPAGQLYLYCLTNQYGLEFGAVSLSPEK